MHTDKSRQILCSQVAHVFRKERISQGVSMTTLAKRAGLSQQMVSYVERGMRNPTLDTMLRIADALEIDLAVVINRANKFAASQQK
jgi:transcriptional regulator with XRE-family HTH domain